MTEPRTVPLTDAQLDNLDLAAIEARLAAATEELPFSHEAWQILHGHAPADLRALVTEVKRLQSLLETDQRASIAAEQDKQHWQEEAERLRLQVAQLAEALEIINNAMLESFDENIGITRKAIE